MQTHKKGTVLFWHEYFLNICLAFAFACFSLGGRAHIHTHLPKSLKRYDFFDFFFFCFLFFYITLKDVVGGNVGIRGGGLEKNRV